MKNYYILVFLVLCSLSSNPSFSQGINPYSSGGNQYGGDSLSTPPTSSVSSIGNQNSFNNSVDSLGTSTRSPYGSATISQASTSSPLYSSGASYPSSSAAYESEITNAPGPLERMGQWVKRKTNRPSGQPELDLANQRIEAGKARIKAVKARQKLEKHIVDSNNETEKLRRELQRAEEEATLLENQIKFQEANAGISSSQDMSY